MRKTSTLVTLAAAALLAAPAMAATDYLLELGGVDGEAAAPLAIDSWSFGTCNAGQCGTISSSDNLSAAPTSARKRSHGKATISDFNFSLSRSVGDVDGDGQTDLAAIARLPEVTGFTITVPQMTPALRKVCTGKHFTSVTIEFKRTMREEAFVISDAAITCSGPRQTAGRAAAAAATASCDATSCDLPGAVTITVNSGQMRHTKTGHVTLMK